MPALPVYESHPELHGSLVLRVWVSVTIVESGSSLFIQLSGLTVM